jgi:hypothetical protein
MPLRPQPFGESFLKQKLQGAPVLDGTDHICNPDPEGPWIKFTKLLKSKILLSFCLSQKLKNFAIH